MVMCSTVSQLLGEAQRSLGRVSSARLDAEVLLAAAMNAARETLYARPEREVPAGVAADFQSLILKRAQGFPVAYLTGSKEFWSMELDVNQHTLIPRPETEIVVETALAVIPEDAAMNILELGTGSGAIALALARERSGCRLTATDVCLDALTTARVNAERHGLGNITFRRSDWFSAFTDEVFDLIVSNPPYVDSKDSGFTDGEIRFEPRIALDGGCFGMQIINHLISAAGRYLKHGAWMILEHGHDQAEDIRALFADNKFVEPRTVQDLAQLDRVSYARYS